MAIVLEVEFDPQVGRRPLFRQQLHVIGSTPPAGDGPVSLARLAELPLVLPPIGVKRRDLVDRTLASAGLRPNIVLEANSVPSELAAARSGAAYTVLPAGDMSHYPAGVFAKPVTIEPSLEMTCSLIVSSDFPLTVAGEALRELVIPLIETYVDETAPPGAEWIPA